MRSPSVLAASSVHLTTGERYETWNEVVCDVSPLPSDLDARRPPHRLDRRGRACRRSVRRLVVVELGAVGVDHVQVEVVVAAPEHVTCTSPVPSVTPVGPVIAPVVPVGRVKTFAWPVGPVGAVVSRRAAGRCRHGHRAGG
jgi:hypothetical protein